MRKLDKKLFIVLLAVVLVLGALIFLLPGGGDSGNTKTNDTNLDAGYGMEVVSVGSYTGPYIEDASDAEVSDILMIQVKNNGEQAVQYGELTLTDESGETALFKFSTLDVGQTMTVLEANKKEYNKDANYVAAMAANVALFPGTLNTYEKQLEIQPLDGGLNVKNISDKDINGEIIIYFKDCNGDTLTGGITYRGRIPGGIPAGSMTQLMSENFTKENTKVMFITIDGE